MSSVLLDAHERLLLATPVELGNRSLEERDLARDPRVQRPIFAGVDIEPRPVPGALLAHQHLAGKHPLTVMALHTTPLGGAVAIVGSRAAGFLMCHSTLKYKSIVSYCKV